MRRRLEAQPVADQHIRWCCGSAAQGISLPICSRQHQSRCVWSHCHLRRPAPSFVRLCPAAAWGSPCRRRRMSPTMHTGLTSLRSQLSHETGLRPAGGLYSIGSIECWTEIAISAEHLSIIRYWYAGPLWHAERTLTLARRRKPFTLWKEMAFELWLLRAYGRLTSDGKRSIAGTVPRYLVSSPNILKLWREVKLFPSRGLPMGNTRHPGRGLCSNTGTVLAAMSTTNAGPVHSAQAVGRRLHVGRHTERMLALGSGLGSGLKSGLKIGRGSRLGVHIDRRWVCACLGLD